MQTPVITPAIDVVIAEATQCETAPLSVPAQSAIWVIDDGADDGELVFELVQASETEIDTLLNRLSAVLG